MLLSKIPIQELRKRKKQSDLALHAMQELQDRRYGGLSFWWFLGTGLTILTLVLLTRISL
jgi:hypothetical protein